MLKKMFARLGLLLAGTTMAVASGCEEIATMIQNLLGDIQLPV